MAPVPQRKGVLVFLDFLIPSNLHPSHLPHTTSHLPTSNMHTSAPLSQQFT